MHCRVRFQQQASDIRMAVMGCFTHSSPPSRCCGGRVSVMLQQRTNTSLAPVAGCRHERGPATHSGAVGISTSLQEQLKAIGMMPQRSKINPVVACMVGCEQVRLMLKEHTHTASRTPPRCDHQGGHPRTGGGMRISAVCDQKQSNRRASALAGSKKWRGLDLPARHSGRSPSIDK